MDQVELSSIRGASPSSFDVRYVNVNARLGYFARSLQVYDREGEPCSCCGKNLVREAFMNRSSYFCPKCQRRCRRAE